MMDKKAQIGETLTWIIATLIIVVILSISVLFTFSFSGSKIIYIEDKEKDFLATKSITSFLSKSENVELLKKENSEESKLKIEKFLGILTVSPIGGVGGWNFEREYLGETLETSTYSIITNVFGQYDYFEIKISSEKMKLRFWKECQGKCR